jgi:hypothetical protein
MFKDPEYNESYEEYLEMLENYPNYEEYAELFDEFSYIELSIAFDAIHDHEVADKLFEEESPLLVFLVDSEMQEKLFLFFEDEQNASKEYDW